MPDTVHIKRETLTAMSHAEVLNGALRDTRRGKCYREEMFRREPQWLALFSAMPATAAKLAVRLATTQPAPAQPETPFDDGGVRDVRKMLEKLKEASAIKPFCAALLNSGWDFTDPGYLVNGKLRKMTKSPQEVINFLSQYVHETGWASSWNELSEEQQRLLRMICHAYSRYMAKLLGEKV